MDTNLCWCRSCCSFWLLRIMDTLVQHAPLPALIALPTPQCFVL